MLVNCKKKIRKGLQANRLLDQNLLDLQHYLCSGF